MRFIKVIFLSFIVTLFYVPNYVSALDFDELMSESSKRKNKRSASTVEKGKSTTSGGAVRSMDDEFGDIHSGRIKIKTDKAARRLRAKNRNMKTVCSCSLSNKTCIAYRRFDDPTASTTMVQLEEKNGLKKVSICRKWARTIRNRTPGSLHQINKSIAWIDKSLTRIKKMDTQVNIKLAELQNLETYNLREEERRREERAERKQELAEERRRAESRQASNSGSGINWGKAFAIAAGAALANSSDMSSSDKAEFMESYTKDVLNDTGGTNTRALGERVERDMLAQKAQNEERDRRWNEQNRKREERESKYYREGADRSKAYSEGRYVKKVKPKAKMTNPLPKAPSQANTQVAKLSQPSYMNDPRIIEGIWKRADGTVIEVTSITKWAVGGYGRFITYGSRWKKYFRKYREINDGDLVPPAMKLRSIKFLGKGTWSSENLWYSQKGDKFKRYWKKETITLKDENNFSVGGSNYKRQ